MAHLRRNELAMLARRCSVIVFAAAALLLSGCGARSERAVVATVAPSPTIDFDSVQISDDQLALMVLPLSEFGGAYASYRVSSDSGFRTNEREIRNAADQQRTADDIKRYGRRSGYDQTYISAEAYARMQGTLLIGSDVELFDTPDGASGYLAAGPDEVKREMTSGSNAATIESETQFDAGALGQESLGLEMAFSYGNNGVPMHAVVVAFRRGRLFAAASLLSTDQTAPRDEVLAFAGRLDGRLQAVLRGEVQPEPTPVGTSTPTSQAQATAEARRQRWPTATLQSFRFSDALTLSLGASGGMSIRGQGEFQVLPAGAAMACTVDYSLAGSHAATERLTVIGDRAWLDDGTGYRERPADDHDVQQTARFCAGADAFWRTYGRSDIGKLPAVPETKNGVPALHYPIDEILKAMGSSGLVMPELTGVNFKAFDVWVAQQGGWLVSTRMDLEADAQGLAQAFGMKPASLAERGELVLEADVTSPDAGDIRIEPPQP